MNDSSLEHLLPDYWAGNLPPDKHAEVEKWLQSGGESADSAARMDAMWDRLGDLPAIAPADHVRHDFYAMLSAHQRITGRSSKTQGSWWANLVPNQPIWQFTFGIGVFLLGVVLSPVINPVHRQMNNQIYELTQTINSISLLQQASAIDRMRAVEMVSQLRQPNEYVLTSLLETLNNDPDVNVRLATIDALAAYYSQNEFVQEGVASSLMTQDSPMVKAVLVDLLLESDIPGAALHIEKLLSGELDPPLRAHIQERLESIQ